MKRNILIAAAVLSAAGAAQATELKDLKVGDAVVSSIQNMGASYELPAGQWHVVATEEHNGNTRLGNFRVSNAMLANVSKGKLVGFIRLIASTAGSGTVNGWTSDPCGSALKGYYFKESFNNSFNFPECLYTKPILGLNQSGKNSYWTSVQENTQALGAKIPAALIYVDYSKYIHSGFIQFSAWLNPELAKIKSNDATDISDSQWNPAKIDGEFRTFTITAEKWARIMATNVASSLDGKSVPTPEFPYNIK